MDNADHERRLSDLERRVASLERAAPVADPTPASEPLDPAVSLVSVAVSNKRTQGMNPNAGIFQETVWYDSDFLLDQSAKPTAAVKGNFEFCDVFGDPKFAVEYTINDPLIPGRPLRVQGIGFEFNQFMPDHQWVSGTDLSHMRVRFRVSQVIYSDGTSSWLS